MVHKRLVGCQCSHLDIYKQPDDLQRDRKHRAHKYFVSMDSNNARSYKCGHMDNPHQYNILQGQQKLVVCVLQFKALAFIDSVVSIHCILYMAYLANIQCEDFLRTLERMCKWLYVIWIDTVH